jgi:hypothetical protein
VKDCLNCGGYGYVSRTVNGVTDAIPCPRCKSVEQGYQVWRCGLNSGQVWVAAKDVTEVGKLLFESRPHECRGQEIKGELEPDLDIGSFEYGDPEDDGEEPEPCTLRDLIKYELAARMDAPGMEPMAMLIAETRY